MDGIKIIYGKKSGMSKYFKDNLSWNSLSKNIIGIPRPFFKVLKSEQYKNGKFHLHPKIPIPWQSEPHFKDGRAFNIIYENEEKVYPHNICPYCGKTFLPIEESTRWTGSKKKPTKDGPSILSDSFPFHIECMKQARIFCPFMRQVPEEQFEYGTYGKLKLNSVKYMKDLGII
jgi:hypothetical protein